MSARASKDIGSKEECTRTPEENGPYKDCVRGPEEKGSEEECSRAGRTRRSSVKDKGPYEIAIPAAAVRDKS